MINLKMRTEYSFRVAYGKLDDVINNCQGKALAITDRNSTFGHVQFYKKCLEKGIKPIYGVELAVVDNAKEKQSGRNRPGCNFMTFIARNNEGLKNIYELTTLSTEQFYHFPRIDYADIKRISDNGNIYCLSGIHPNLDLCSGITNFYFELSPCTIGDLYHRAMCLDLPVVATNNAYFQTKEDQSYYETVLGRDFDRSTKPMHVLSEEELRQIWDIDEAYENTHNIADDCNVEMVKAQMVVPDRSVSLIDQCRNNGRIDFDNPIYTERLNFELDVIRKKDFEDYFFVIADLVQYAKQHMMVGPARGSSCGSLLCYGLGITDIDPIEYDLLFERFIDVNRNDYPDIDIDFQDNKRDMVFKYLSKKYGKENFAQIGTLSKLTAQVCINETAKAFGISQYDIEEFKESIIERSAGDERADKCIEDSWGTDIGKETLEKYPFLRMANEIEGHCRHTGKHAAGVIVTNSQIMNYCPINRRDGQLTAQIDKDDAEYLNLLKIDALGLRTLTIIQECLDLAGKDREWLSSQPVNRQDVFDIINEKKFVGIFQFEGKALQRVCKQLCVESIEDMSSITSLARPGPMQSGGHEAFINAKNGVTKPFYFNAIHKGITKNTYGVIVYQEQVMHLARQLGNMDWKDVNALRKTIGKSKGLEAIQKYQKAFTKGAMDNGLNANEVNVLWDQIVTMGGYAFNRSHAIAYSMISYWTCLLKRDFPQEYAIACLKHSGDDKIIKILREYSANIGDFVAFDLEKSHATTWSVEDGILYGPLVGAHGIGLVTAKILRRLVDEEEEIPERISKFLGENLKVPYMSVTPCSDKFQDIYDNPEKYNIKSCKPSLIEDMEEPGDYVCIGRVKEFDIRNLNSKKNIEKRGGKVKEGPEKYMILTIEDDTEEIKCYLGNKEFVDCGKALAHEGRWFIFKGKINEGFDLFSIERAKEIS